MGSREESGWAGAGGELRSRKGRAVSAGEVRELAYSKAMQVALALAGRSRGQSGVTGCGEVEADDGEGERWLRARDE